MSKRERVGHRLEQGLRLIKAGRAREAINTLGRILLADPGHTRARHAMEGARRAAAEQARQLEAKIEEARLAAQRGEREQARAILEEVIRCGGDRDRARELLERLERRGGRMAVSLPAPDDSSGGPRWDDSAAAREWPRRVFIATCALVFALTAASLALTWESLVESLIRLPVPRPVSTDFPLSQIEVPRP